LNDTRLAERCRALKLILTDVDGVMTDGTFLLLPDGTEARSFHVRDGLGIVLAQRAGLRTGLVTGKSSASVERRAAELRMDVVRQGVADKLSCLRQILKSEGLTMDEVAFIGDDLNDLPVIQEVGLSATPADAPFELRSAAFMVTDAPGGRGCLREFIEAILRARGEWEALLASMGIHPLA
jgi:3-deoxy-D-manno-octulosonate 8-phosphate phosphatase (KDO 8-P phosphatase)